MTGSWRPASLSGGWEGAVLGSMAVFRPHLSAVRVTLPLVQFHTSQGGETKASQGSFLPRAVQLARDPSRLTCLKAAVSFRPCLSYPQASHEQGDRPPWTLAQDKGASVCPHLPTRPWELFLDLSKS